MANRPLLIVEASDEDLEITCWALIKSILTEPLFESGALCGKIT